ncbi:NmrA family NAD(P)-binding protein [Streptacidiphilus sp. N1-12]|uniref:NmrA family NAD(P)-binding protein n=2 Tax=Streptacidiphilus alkalitolerans TaxID=3342712 RepID=A0ABV6W9Y8_9ACTN
MILVTGASGALGGLIHANLAAAGAEVLAGTHSPGPGSGRRRTDFDDPRSLAEGFAGAEVVVLVSAGYAEDDVVLARHRAAIDAAVRAGVRHVVYTSLAGSGDPLTIALPHRWTEVALADAPLDVTVLRNGLYAEVPTALGLATASAAVATGVFRAPWGSGTVPVVSREDLAEVAATVAREVQESITAGQQSRHTGRTYELDGTGTAGGEDLAAALTEVLGTQVRYRTAPLGETWATLAEAGLAPYQVSHAVSFFSNLNAGTLAARPSDLPALLGRQPRPAFELLVDAVRAGLRQSSPT